MNIFIDSIFSEIYRKSPVVLVDVGAAGGLQPKWKLAEEYLHIIGFEPNKREFAKLQKLQNNNVRYLNIALFREKTSINLYLKRNNSASIFKPNRAFRDRFPEAERSDIIETIYNIETDTIDNQFQRHHIEKVDVIKLDTDGSELFILQGAKETLRNHVFGLEIEVEFTETHYNQPLFSDVDSFARKQGFQLWDIRRHYWKRKIDKGHRGLKGQLIFGDTLYLKSLESFNELIDLLQDDFMKKSKVLNAISICLLYGYTDYALELFNEMSSLFDKNELRIAIERINSYFQYSAKLPHFKGRQRLANTCHRLGSFLESHKYSVSDRKLGN